VPFARHLDRRWDPVSERFAGRIPEEKKAMLGAILIVVLILALLGAVPPWSHSRDWGYFPTGGVSLVLAGVVILVLLGRI